MRVYRVLRGQVLPCGCLAGVYEVFEGGSVAIIDQRADTCREASHRVGIPIEVPALVAVASPADPWETRRASHDRDVHAA